MTDAAADVNPIDRLPHVGPAAVCMGVFDGVHRGHRALVEVTVGAARERGIASVALVFEPHPDEVVRPGTRVPRLAPLDENLRLLTEAGIDRALAVRFDPALRALTPEEFLAALAPSVVVRALVMTPESAFGRNRAGTPEAMALHGAEAGFDVELAAPVLVDGDGPISSARVRSALAAGDLEAAIGLLGHALCLEGIVGGPGPASPLRFDYVPALPAPGAYRAVVTRRNGLASGPEAAGRGAGLEIDGEGRVRLVDAEELPETRLTIELVAAR